MTTAVQTEDPAAAGDKKTARWSLSKRIGVAALLLMVLGYVTFRQVQGAADGPLNAMIPGGVLRTGEWVTEPNPDWQLAPGTIVELQLETPSRSRYVGAFLHDGELYIPCDLGFIWARFSGVERHMMHLVYRFKRWHTDALEDGRVVLRTNGKRYPRLAVRVTDPALETTLRARLEAMARDWVAPDILGPEPQSGPKDIWFFRLDPRAATAATL